MATKLFFRDTGAQWQRGVATLDLAGTGSAATWHCFYLADSAGGGLVARGRATVTGPTAGLEVNTTSLGPIEWVSDPINADTTISGTITFNLWGLENNMSANAGFQVLIQRLDSQFVIQETVINSERGVELATAAAVNNWTGSPTSTNFNKGDRLRVTVLFNDVGTMASGFTATFDYNGGTAAADGDSWIQFTETFGFITAVPTGSQKLYLTDTASAVNPGAAIEKEAWTTAGSSNQTSVTNTRTGDAAPTQCTNTGGGTAVEWYTRQLQAFTLSGLAAFNIWAKESNTLANAMARGEIAVCDADGTNAVVWGAAGMAAGESEFATTDSNHTIYVVGDDVAVAEGQRLRFRLYIDDALGTGAAQASGQTVTVTYNGNSGGAAGDTFVRLADAITLAEFVPAVPVTGFIPHRMPIGV